MSNSVMVWLAVAVLLFWAMGAYNRLVRCRSQGILAFAVLDGLFSQYVALVKTHAPDAQGDETCRAIWLGFSAAAEQFNACLRGARAQPLHGPAMNALRTAHATLFESSRRVHDLSAEPLAPAWLQGLQLEWEQLAIKSDMARIEFNRTVTNYNDAIGQFPALLLAWLFGFKPGQTI